MNSTRDICEVGYVNQRGLTLRNADDARHFKVGDRLLLSSSQEGPPRRGRLTVASVDFTSGFIETAQQVAPAIRGACDGDRVWIEERHESERPAPTPDEIQVAADLLDEHGFGAIADWLRWQRDDLRFVDHHGDSWTPTIKHPPPKPGVPFDSDEAAPRPLCDRTQAPSYQLCNLAAGHDGLHEWDPAYEATP